MVKELSYGSSILIMLVLLVVVGWISSMIEGYLPFYIPGLVLTLILYIPVAFIVFFSYYSIKNRVNSKKQTNQS